MTTQTPATVEI